MLKPDVLEMTLVFLDRCPFQGAEFEALGIVKASLQGELAIARAAASAAAVTAAGGEVVPALPGAAAPAPATSPAATVGDVIRQRRRQRGAARQ